MPPQKKKIMITNAKAQRKSIKAYGKNAPSSTETDAWMKRTKQDFELNEKQRNCKQWCWMSILVHGPEVQLPVDEYTGPRPRGAITCGRVYWSTAPRHSYLWMSILVHGPEAQLPVNEYTCPLPRGTVTCE